MRKGLRLASALAFACGSAALAACGGGGSDPCDGVTGTCVAIHEGASRADVQTAMVDATSGTTIAFEAGLYDMDGELDLDVDGVTLQGAGMGSDGTVLSFKNQTSGGQGLYVTKGHFTAKDIAFEDAPGDIVKTEKVDYVTFDHVRAEYTAGPVRTNGSYAIYPVQCGHVHVHDSYAAGSSDTGIYVGQSHDIVVEHNEVAKNVSGIEIENSQRADVHDNDAHDNTGGILVFNLPGLAVHNGDTCRVFHNNIHDNNEVNFGSPGTTVSLVPSGTGIAILAAHQVEVFDNTIANEKAIHLGIIGYTTTGLAYDDPDYVPYPYQLHIHDNTFTGTSNMPNGDLGALLVLALEEVQQGTVVPDIGWDGVIDPDFVDPNDANELAADHNLCIHDNGDADFVNLRYPPQSDPKADFDLSKHDCTYPPLPEVVLQ
jgi:parallel beta-helix repeat protein